MKKRRERTRGTRRIRRRRRRRRRLRNAPLDRPLFVRKPIHSILPISRKSSHILFGCVRAYTRTQAFLLCLSFHHLPPGSYHRTSGTRVKYITRIHLDSLISASHTFVLPWFYPTFNRSVFGPIIFIPGYEDFRHFFHYTQG